MDDDGLVIVDYKTDTMPAAALDGRVVTLWGGATGQLLRLRGAA